jgi:GTP-binding protein HflX
LADTVGFIRHLPHKLIEAFRATLEEAVEADLLLHVIDCASDDRDANIEQVEHVLKEIGAENIPILEVYNKVDLIDVTPRIDYDANGRPVRVWLSAATGEGTELLERALSESLVDDLVHGRLLLRSEQGALRSAFYKQQVVLAESYSEQGWPELELRMPKSDFCRLVAAAGLDPQQAVSLLQPVH